MNDTNAEIYSEIYHIVESNMIKSCGRSFEYTKDAFIATVTSIAGEADIFKLSKLDNISFIQAAYASCLFRTADEGSFRNWKARAEQEPNKMKEALLNSVLRSEEFAMKGVLIKNNIYTSTYSLSTSIANVPNKPAEINTNSNNGINKLYRIYKKLPKLIRSVIRKIAGVK